MEVKGQLILAPEPLTCPNRKQKERMAELQERRRSLQALLSTRLAELRRICLQEAELTGAVPSDFPLEAGEKPPCIRRRGGTFRQGNRKCRVEQDEDGQRAKPRKTLFSAALRKHSDSENSTHTQTHTHHGKRTVHRGCHTDDNVRSESSSASDSTGNDNDNGVSQCRPLLVSAGSPVEVFNQNKTKKNSVLSRPELRETSKPPPLPPSHPPPPPPRSQDSSSSSDAGREGGCKTSRQSNGSDVPPSGENVGVQQGAVWVNGATVSRGTNAAGLFWSAETLADRRTRTNPGASEGGGRAAGQGGGRGGGYSEVLLDYVWEKQRQLQRQQSQPSRPPNTSQQQPLHNGCSAQPPHGAPPTYRSHHGDQRRVTVTRTKSCGPFLPVQQNQADVNLQAPPTIQPDPHPHLLPPRPPQLPPTQDSQLEEATRSLHKALALEGLRDWYLRNTLGSSQQNQACGKVSAGADTKPSDGLKGPAEGCDALQRRRTTHGVLQQSTYQSHHYAVPHHKQTLPHSATFHGHPLHGRSVDSSLYLDSFPSQKQEVSLRDMVDQPSPGTLV
ncbi:FERM domain-containing protein 4B isoform X1 [Fundulus heteroclitus]|uniref:FERM domain-containing protein 4B isoform X1 n=1 Tax=Fundulus heteroclitus TaxID=8078 RepID=UPI00165A5AD8|nr:FERM domain-containing protein 4B isoform X1 [Fundulus heteroclitus]XP_035999845.1 FERM domain-containing protein 4B isoform X1 [Fundulus heteroclitus]XP_035999852.1 FERM domain-containing protein 4B isoform X1 [Fundulus heteroclitus]